MHKIKKRRSLCFVNFWWNLRKWKHFFILSITKSCFKMLDCGIICHFLINLFLRIFFQMGKRKICQTVWIRNIENTVPIKRCLTRLIQAQNEKATAFSQSSSKVDKTKWPYFFDILHISPCFGHLLLNVYKMLGLRLRKNFPTNYFLAWCIQREFKKTFRNT